MNKVIPLVVIVVVIIGIGGFLVFNSSQKKSTTNSASQANNQNNSAPRPQSFQFETPKKSAHFESSTPGFGDVLPDQPINIVINFNFDLSDKSTISVEKDGQQYGVGKTSVDQNKLALKQVLADKMPDGLYKVTYNACWPDNSCHDGNFQFGIDRSEAANYEDLSNQPQVQISLSEIKFNPKNVRISKGTQVIWENEENIDHYINADSHPAHTYFPAQNSQVIRAGETYSLVFDKPGFYPYHCSAHADSMVGGIIVE